MVDRGEITAEICSGGAFLSGGRVSVADGGPAGHLPVLEDLCEFVRDVVGQVVLELRRGLAEEVRTGRIVVVDDIGVERIATRTTPTASTLEVMAPGRSPSGRSEAGAVAGRR